MKSEIHEVYAAQLMDDLFKKVISAMKSSPKKNKYYNESVEYHRHYKVEAAVNALAYCLVSLRRISIVDIEAVHFGIAIHNETKAMKGLVESLTGWTFDWDGNCTYDDRLKYSSDKIEQVFGDIL